MTYYYREPSPERVPSAIRFIVGAGTWENAKARAFLVAFFGQIFRENAKRVPSWLDELDQVPEEGKKLVWSALWFSNTEGARMLLEQQTGSELSPERRGFLQGLLVNPPPDILSEPVASPAVLDMLWAMFMASGDERYVQKIIGVLPWLNEEGAAERIEKGAAERMLIGGAARWSLTSNAFQHDRVLQICRAEVERQPEEVRVVLREVIQSAEQQLRDREQAR